MLEKLKFSFRRTGSGKEKDGTESPKHSYTQDSTEKVPAEQLRAMVPDWQDKEHRWAGIDYSNCMYGQDRHPVCRNFSRKLSDLGPVRPIEPSAVQAVIEPREQPDGVTAAEDQQASGSTKAQNGQALQKRSKGADPQSPKRHSSSSGSGSGVSGSLAQPQHCQVAC